MYGNKLMIIVVLGLAAAIVGMIAIPSGAQPIKVRIYQDPTGKPIAVDPVDPVTGQEIKNYTYKAADGSVVPHISELDPAMQDLLKKGVEQPPQALQAPESPVGTVKSAPRFVSAGGYMPYNSEAQTEGSDKVQQYRYKMWRRVHMDGARRLAEQGPKIPLSRTGLYPVSSLAGIQP